MAGEGDKVGTASVDIIANISLDEASLQAAEERLASIGTKDAAPAAATRAKRGKTDVQADVKGNVTIDKRKVENDIQSALDGEFRLSIDKSSVRAQVEAALRDPFTITINAEVSGAAAQHQGVGAAHTPSVTAGAPLGRGAPPEEVAKALTKPMKDAIDNLHRNITDAYAVAGKTFGQGLGTEPGNQAQKAADIVERFGSRFDEFLKIEKNKAGVPRITGGSMSAGELGKALGIDPNDEALKTVQNAGAMGLRTSTKERGETDSQINRLLIRTASWIANTPMSAQPGAASQPTASAPVNAAEREANRKLIDVQEQAVKEARQGVLEERQRSIATRPIDVSPFASGPRLVGPRTESADPEADSRARRELGNDRANVRRLRGMGGQISFGGKSVNLETYLRAAEAGRFEGAFEQFGKGGESKGITGLEGIQLAGDDQPDPGAVEEELGRLRGRKPGVKFGIAGQEGRFARVSPSEALIRKVISDLGVEEDAASSETVRASMQGEMERIRQAVQKGSSPARGVSGETKRGQGKAGIVSVGSMRPDPEFDPFAQTRRLTSKEIALRNLESQRNVAEGVGFTSREKDLRSAMSPESQGLIGKYGLASMGLEGGAETIQSALMQRYLANQSRIGEEEFAGGTGRANAVRDANGNIVGWGQGEASTGRGSRTGKQTLRQAAFGPTGRARRNPGEDEDTGIYGELVSQIPGDTPKATRKTLERAISDILSATLEDDAFKRDAAEQAITAKEGLTRGNIPGRRTSSAMRTDEGFDVLTGRPRAVTGEGEFLNAPGVQGRIDAMLDRNRRIKEGIDPMPPKESEYPYSDPDTDEGRQAVVNLLEERHQRELTRAKTMGKGKYQSGDDTEKLAREAGLPMEAEEAALPFAAFSARYGGGGAGRGGGGAGAGGAGGGGLGVSGVVPVRVVNWPTGWGGGGGGRGRTTDGAGMPDGEGGGVPSKRIRYVGRERVVQSTGKQKFIEDQEKMYAGLFDQQDAEAVRADKQRTRAAQGYNRAMVPPASREERSSMYEGMFKKLESQEKQRQQQIAKQAGLTSGQYASPAALRRTIGLPSAESRSEQDFTLLDEADAERSKLAARARRAERGIPKRGFTASVTDIFANLGGFLDDQVAAVTRYQREGQQLSSLLEREAKQKLEVRDRTVVAREASVLEAGAESHVNYLKQIGASKDEIDGASAALGHFKSLTKAAAGSVKEGEEALAGYSASVENQAKIVAAAEKKLPGPGGKAVAFGVGFGAAAGAVAVGQLVSQVTSALIDGVAQAAGPIGERLTGFGATTGRLQEGIAGGIRASGDDVRATLAQQAIAARLSDTQFGMVSENLGTRGQTVANTQSLAAQRDLFNASRNIARGGTEGFDRSLFRSTGGLFDFQGQGPISDISIGGQASTAETLQGSLKDLQDPGSIKEVNPSIFDPMSLPWGGTFGPQIGDSIETRQAQANELRDKLLEENNDLLAGLNDNLEGTKFQLVPSEDLAALDKQAAMFSSAGAQGLGIELKDQGLLAQGINQRGRPIQEVGGFLKAYNEGPELDAGQLLELNARPRKARAEGQLLQREFQLSQIEPRLAMQQIRQPMENARSGIAFSKDDDSEQVKRLNSELDTTQKKYDQINTEIDMGVKAAKDFVTYGYELNGVMTGGLGAEAGAAFASSLDNVARISKQIQSIEVGIETKQAAFAAKQFSYQIDIAKRSLADAKGLVSGMGNNMGAVERQMFNLQRQSQALSMGLSQSQINFQRAVAGFQSPGLTSEEREARKEAAKIEADYAQKQLNIQKQLFGLSGKQFNMGAARQVQDLSRQIGLLTEGRALALDVQVDQKKIRALTKDLQAAEAESEAYYNAAVEATQDIFADSVQLVSQTGEALTTITNDVINAYRRTFAEVIAGTANLISRIEGGAPGSRDPKEGETRSATGNLFMDDYSHAEGWMGSVSGKTSFGKYGVAGEAGGEAVAILRDPKNLVSPAGGSGGGVTNYIVNIMNPVVRKDEDLRKIVTDVKKALQTEARLVLPRGA